ncbi:MAG TPA: phospholipase D family protein [Mycobacteriales bacterium]|jgi:phosphatidylserine/phosphatidylglycerophosphate/cardiolipin synthase-like enzyme|nr:phospholipase D family protein [Mycobacteriales bacterium]
MAQRNLDGVLGDSVDRLVESHHRRRLTRLGWGHVLAPAGPDLWASGDLPPRAGNAVTVHVDGSAALPRIAAAIRGAQRSVLLAAWHASPEFRLERHPGAVTARELLAETAERVPVRLLMWAGPPAPVFQPTRKVVHAARDGFMRGTKVTCALDARERTLHCHHEKLVVIDDELAFVGGIDLTALAGDRYDEPGHPPHGSLGWHDAAVELRGPIVADVAAHLGTRWTEVTRERLPAAPVPGPAGSTTVQLVRTVPENTYQFAARGRFSALDSYLRALSSAQRLVYLENQFLWSTEIVAVLARLLREPPHPDFRMVLVLPAKPNNGKDTTRGQLGRLIDADDGNGRLLACTLSAFDGARSGPLYVHAKIGLVDDRWLTIGSANLNEHSLFNDTEVNVVLREEELVRQTRLRLWAEHLRCEVSELDADPTEVIDARWRPIATAQLDRHDQGLPPTHPLRLLPGVSRRAERLIGPLRGLLVDA